MKLQMKNQPFRFADGGNSVAGIGYRMAFLSATASLCMLAGCGVDLEQAETNRIPSQEIGSDPSGNVGTASQEIAALDLSAEQAAEQAAAEQAAAEQAADSLGIGDPNPGLKLAKYVKGEAVETPLEGEVTVVEFWATWCGPCLAGMPHISALQQKYDDKVRFIGVTREEESVVTGFLAKTGPGGKTWDDVIQYRLALDENNWTNNAYMRAANQNGIPCAFIVGRDGIVEWIGHPAGIDEPLKQIVDGKWDREAAVKEFEQQAMLAQIGQKLNGMVRSGNFDAALTLLDEMSKSTGKSAQILDYRMKILTMADRDDEASKVRSELVELAWDDATMLNGIAWETATAENPTDLELALKAAQRATEIRENKDAATLDTVARCQYELGNLDEAIKLQQMAVDADSSIEELAETLKKYQDENASAKEK